MYSFLPGRPSKSLIFSQLCTFVPSFCLSFIADLTGPSDELNTTRLPTYLHFVPAGALLCQSLCLLGPARRQAQCASHFLGIFSGCVTHQTDRIVDLPPTTVAASYLPMTSHAATPICAPMCLPICWTTLQQDVFTAPCNDVGSIL